MSIEVINGIFALGGLLVGGIITWLLQKDRLIKEYTVAIEAIKTDYMAEKTALYYLNHKGYTDRSFELLSKRLGGFEDNELRKILVRCGAVRYMRDDGTEWWRLLSRSEEVVKKRKGECESLGVNNKDL
jgi:hypothetical protein